MPHDNEDGIEFIGFSHSSPAKSRISSSQPSSPVTGITIHIDSPSTDPAKYTFHKSHGPSVVIGRLSGMDAHGKLVDVDDNKALFRCPVVSRTHAKIAFSDSGYAYLIDLSSHHGTFLLQGQAKEPQKLEPETPLRLLDNAKVTFGKSVGKGDEMVDPISVTIQLLHQSPPKTSSIQRTNSGRFSAPFEISDEDSIYNDSDVEEIPPPPPPASIPPPIPTTSSFPSFIPFGPLSVQQQQQEQASSVGLRALDVIKTLMPQHPPFSRYIPSIPSLSPPGLTGDYASRDFTPFQPAFTPEYSPGFDEFNQMIESGIEYYDTPAPEKKGEEEKEKEEKEEEKKIEGDKDKDKDLNDCPSPDSNMDLETPAPASRRGSPSRSVSGSASPSRSVSPSHTRSLSREKQGYEENYIIRKYALPEFAGGDLSEDEDVLQAVEAAEARDKASQRSTSSICDPNLELDEEIAKAANAAAAAEEEEEDTDAESVSTTFDPFASFHSHSGFDKNWFGSHEFGPQGVSGTFSVPILVRAPGGDDDDVAGNTTSTTTTTTTTTTTSPGKTVTTISTTLGGAQEKGSPHPDTLPPITAAAAAHQLRALPPLADMRFMGMNGMNDVLCEASVWVDSRKSAGKEKKEDVKEEKKVEKVEKEVKEKVKEKEEKKEKEKEKEDVDMLRAEEEEEEGEEDAEGVDDDEVDMDEDEEEADEEEEEEEYEEDDDDDDEDADELMEDVSGLKQDVTRIQGEVNKLTSQRKKYKSRFNANVRAVEERFSSIGSSLAALAPVPTELKEVKAELEKLVVEVGDVNEHVGELREEMWQVSNERDALAEEEREREKEREEKEREVVQLALADLKAAQREMGRVAERLGTARGEADEVKREVKEVRKVVDGVEMRGKVVESDVADVKEDVASLKAALEQLKTVTNGLAALVETRHKEAKTYADNRVLSVHIEQVLMQNKLDTHTGKIEDLNKELEGVMGTRFDALSSRLDDLQADLDDARVKDEDRSDHFGRRMSLAEKRLDEMEMESADAVESVDDVAARVDDFEALGLDERVSAVEQDLEKQEKRSEGESKIQSEREEAVRELRSLVAEMRQLRDETQKQMAHDLQSVKAAKELAMVCINKTTQSFSLKRKRDDMVEDAGALSPVGISSPPTPAPTSSSSSSTLSSSAAAAPAQDVIMGDAPEASLSDVAQSQGKTEESESALQAYESPPPRKRARKVVSVIARSASIMTVGAAITWTALAYS